MPLQILDLPQNVRQLGADVCLDLGAAAAVVVGRGAGRGQRWSGGGKLAQHASNQLLVGLQNAVHEDHLHLERRAKHEAAAGLDGL